VFRAGKLTELLAAAVFRTGKLTELLATAEFRAVKTCGVLATAVFRAVQTYGDGGHNSFKGCVNLRRSQQCLGSCKLKETADTTVFRAL
jgi:hypothetical protein